MTMTGAAAFEEISKRATALCAADPELGKPAAIAKAIRAEPSLYRIYAAAVTRGEAIAAPAPVMQKASAAELVTAAIVTEVRKAVVAGHAPNDMVGFDTYFAAHPDVYAAYRALRRRGA